MYPTVTDKDVLGIPFLEPPRHVTDRVKELVQSGFGMIEKAQQQLNEAIALMTKHIQEPPMGVLKSNTPKVQQERKGYRVRKRKG